MSSFLTPAGAGRVVAPPPPVETSGDGQVSILYEFSKDPYFEGWLTYDKVKQIQAYIAFQGETALVPFASGFEKLSFTGDEFKTFKRHFKENYTVKVDKVGGKKFDVFLKLIPSAAEKEKNIEKEKTEEQKKKRELEQAYSLNSLGSKHLQSGNTDQALIDIQGSIAIQERLTPRSIYLADAYENLGDAYKAGKELGKSLEAYQCSLQIRLSTARSRHRSLDRARCHMIIGDILAKCSQPLLSSEHFDEGLVIYERLIPNSLKLACSYIQIGKFYFDNAKLTLALGCFEKSLLIFDDLEIDSLDKAESLEAIGTIYFEMGNLARAREFLQKSLNIRERLDPDSLESADCHILQARVFQKLAQSPKALEHIQMFILIFSQLSPQSLISRYANFKKNIHYFESHASENLSKAASYEQIGKFFWGQRKLNRALNYYKKSLELRQKIESPNLAAAQTLDCIAIISMTLDQANYALESLQQSLAIRERLDKESVATANCHACIASIYQKFGVSEKAMSHIQESFAVFSGLNSEKQTGKLVFFEENLEFFKLHASKNISVATSYRHIGKIFLNDNKRDRAFGSYKKSLELFELLAPHDPETAAAHVRIGEIYQLQGRLKPALEAFKLALAISPQYPPALHRYAKTQADLVQQGAAS